jgi:hypothetical protein
MSDARLSCSGCAVPAWLVIFQLSPVDRRIGSVSRMLGERHCSGARRTAAGCRIRIDEEVSD